MHFNSVLNKYLGNYYFGNVIKYFIYVTEMIINVFIYQRQYAYNIYFYLPKVYLQSHAIIRIITSKM